MESRCWRAKFAFALIAYSLVMMPERCNSNHALDTLQRSDVTAGRRRSRWLSYPGRDRYERRRFANTVSGEGIR